MDYYEIKKQTCNYMCKRDKCPDQKIKPRKRRYPPRICGKIDRSQYFKRHGFPDPEKTIVTMGTNGKTTTNAILYKALKAEGKTVIINRTGANMLNGIISAFVLATDKHGQLNADYACIEVDEIASVGVLPQLKPDCALLTNISRDQLDRFGEVDITFDRIENSRHQCP